MKTKREEQPLQLSEPDQLVAEYLQTLLNEVEEYKEPVNETPDTAVTQGQDAAPVTAPKVEPAAAPVASSAVHLDIEEQPQPVIPHWGKGRFQCLLFEINGLHLAVPLSELSSIAGKLESGTTHLLGQPEWHRGILAHRGHKVGVIDIARLVMPGKLSPVTEQTVSPNHVLIIGNGEWGLMCDKLLSPVMVESDDVHWSCRHKNRAWMAGTLPDQLCIIIDLDVLLTMIQAGNPRSHAKTGMNNA
ncbi:MAG: chemotaxis protein CheW [Candidatus Polarisedimenticolaceae bacterium]|nr:chemotaxis protein CheW [Candidatus Polarisedimenticolaceae bacterium]